MTNSIKRIAMLSLFLLVGQTCRKTEEPPSKQTPAEPPAAEPSSPENPKAVPRRIDFQTPLDDAGQWLFVQKVAEKAKGGWATGLFDAERNKLRITTSDVEEFAVDTGRIQIDWKKLVVLSIDGRNSELRKRDVAILHFVREPHGEWIIREP